MRANKVRIFNDVLAKNGRIFKVPVYQRRYDWREEQCRTLFKDILCSCKENCQHFTGTIVYLYQTMGSGIDELLIIDGQQRLTSIYLLLKALYDCNESFKGGEGTSEGQVGTDKITSQYFPLLHEQVSEVIFNRYCDESLKIKIHPVSEDEEVLRHLFEKEMNQTEKDKIKLSDDKTIAFSRIYQNYQLFRELIAQVVTNPGEGKDKNQRQMDCSRILSGIKNLEVVEIILDKSEGDNPQKIFESLNSTGLELSLSDLVRNYLLMDEKEQEKLYKNYWLCIEKYVGYTNLGDYMLNYISSKMGRTITVREAYSIFKKYVETKQFSHEDVLKDLKKNALYYGVFLGRENLSSDSVNKDLKEISILIHDFYRIKQSTVLPYLFSVLTDYEIGSVDIVNLKKVLQYLLSYVVRLNACEINKNMAKFFASMHERLIKNVSDKEDYYEKFVLFLNDNRTDNRMPTDEEFQNALLYKPLYKKNICKYILARLENDGKEQLSVQDLTIEHILPQKENAVLWKNYLGVDYISVYEKYLHTLGNLTITGQNSVLGTKSFSEKKELIKKYSKANILNKDVLSAEKWNESSILSRAHNLSIKLLKLFPYEDMHRDTSSQDSLPYHLEEKVDLKHRTPRAFLFQGEEKSVNTWKDFLNKLVCLLYKENEGKIEDLAREDYKISGANKPYLTFNAKKLRDPVEIEDSGIFFEANHNANTIASFIRALLKELGIEENDLSFSLEEKEGEEA
jgi:hypothetical protein